MNPHPNPVGWFEIYVQDMDRAKAFYEAVFQCTLTHLPSPTLEMWAFPYDAAAPGCGGALAKMPDKDSGGGGTIVYFAVEDCAVVVQRVVAAGGTVHLDKMSIGEYGHIALVLDTEGNLIGLHSQT